MYPFHFVLFNVVQAFFDNIRQYAKVSPIRVEAVRLKSWGVHLPPESINASL